MVLNFFKENNVFFCSDLHLGHKKEFIWESRGYSSCEEHTESVINKINERVTENDNLFVLGDFCLNSTEDQFEKYISSIKCKNIHLLWGNHFNPIKRIYVREKNKRFVNVYGDVYPFSYKNIIFLGDYQEIFVNNQMICLSHYPIISWNDQSHGSWHLFGHTHGNLNIPLIGKILEVSWDCIKKPLSFDEINQIMDSKPITSIDHHKNN